MVIIAGKNKDRRYKVPREGTSYQMTIGMTMVLKFPS